jgi:DNA polymerase (family 10)
LYTATIHNKIIILLDNKLIIGLLNKIATLLALHGANPFQAKHYTNAALFLEKVDKEVMHLSLEELEQIKGISKSLITLIQEVQNTGTLQRWQELMEQTPTGILDILKLPGLGPKKVRALWQELGIQNIEELEEACRSGRVAHLSGFGDKTQASILEALSRALAYSNRFHYATVLPYTYELELAFKAAFPQLLILPVGDFRRKLEVVTTVEYLVGTIEASHVLEWLHNCTAIQQNPLISGPFSWRGYFIDNELPLTILFCAPTDFYKQLILQTGSDKHLSLAIADGNALGKFISQSAYISSESEGYQQAGFPYIPVELREGLAEKVWIEAGAPPLIEVADLKGVFHVHTKYSDGQTSLENMASYCQSLGYSYLGITDHSQSAAYAGGLRPHTVKEQHHAIDELNQQLAPFKIFKGIESDILPNGDLDYPDEVLSEFDFTIVSVHMGLNMDEGKATDRLIKAISNPFTTILGHATGRLLLKREGYPINYQAVIDACAAYGVIIEINANPWRLDLDWRWVPYAIQKGVKLSINPDAHHHTDIANVQYGVDMGRKGALTKDHTFNTLTQEEVENYFQKRKAKALAIAKL